MDEATLKTAANALEQWGVIGALVVVFLAILFAGYKLAVRWMDKQAVVPRDNGHPVGAPGLKTLFTLKASEVKEEAKRAHETLNDRTERLEKKTDALRDELFRVMGEHRKALESRIDKIEATLRDGDKENTRQDRDMMNLSSRVSTIEGIMKGASTKSGATQYVVGNSTLPPADNE